VSIFNFNVIDHYVEQGKTQRETIQNILFQWWCNFINVFGEFWNRHVKLRTYWRLFVNYMIQ